MNIEKFRRDYLSTTWRGSHLPDKVENFMYDVALSIGELLEENGANPVPEEIRHIWAWSSWLGNRTSTEDVGERVEDEATVELIYVRKDNNGYPDPRTVLRIWSTHKENILHPEDPYQLEYCIVDDRSILYKSDIRGCSMSILRIIVNRFLNGELTKV